jgi:hypothetical protein
MSMKFLSIKKYKVFYFKRKNHNLNRIENRKKFQKILHLKTNKLNAEETIIEGVKTKCGMLMFTY